MRICIYVFVIYIYIFIYSQQQLTCSGESDSNKSNRTLWTVKWMSPVGDGAILEQMV